MLHRIYTLIFSVVFVFSSCFAGSTKRKVYDCFPFYNELDRLEIRLHELDDVVDYFVIVEGNRTHQGKQKPLYFEENKHRFSKFLHKIIHRVADLSDMKLDCWDREGRQRDHIMKVLKSVGCRRNDIVIISDADEITRASSLKLAISQLGSKRVARPELIFLNHDVYAIFLNCRRPGVSTGAAFITTRGFFNKRPALTPSGLRRGGGRFKQFPVLDNAGWHFTWVGSPQTLVQKVNGVVEHLAHAETEQGRAQYWEQVKKNKTSLFGCEVDIVPVDESFPKLVKQDIKRYIDKELIAPWDE